MKMARIAAGGWGRGEVRRRRFGRAKERRHVFGGVGRAVFGALGELVRDGPPVPATSAHISSRLASSICWGVAMRPRLATRRPAARAARRMRPEAQMSL
jgi:hypothetical protein